MGPVLGKRKKRSALDDVSSKHPLPSLGSDSEQIQSLLKQHFEKSFRPLHSLDTVSTLPSENENEVDIVQASEWEGLSDEDEDHARVVQYNASNSSKVELPKNEIKAFMTSKPPTSNTLPTSKPRAKDMSINEPDDADESANLKKDLALQRLLKESHLLEPKSSLSHTGQNRHKAHDLRLREMGSRSSIFSQQKMPLAQRKGITAKAVEREETRRREALDNGIVLEKAGSSKKRADMKRKRGIGAPTVGKFRGGTLRLSTKDVAEIQGPKKVSRGSR